MTNYTLEIDSDKKCAECGRPYVTPCGLCLKCASNAIAGKPMKSDVGKAVQARMRKEVKP